MECYVNNLVSQVVTQEDPTLVAASIIILLKSKKMKLEKSDL